MYENYTIRQFEKALFKNDRSVISEEDFNIVHSEFIDTAGLYESEEFNRVAYIERLNGRINTIKLSIKLQKEFLYEFGIPYIPGFYRLKSYGYLISWKDNEEDFLKTLVKIENLEKKYINEVENCIKQLIDFRKKKNNGIQEDPPVKIKRENWIRTIISLEKIGYKINKDIDSPEDLALMIKQEKEENKKH